MRIDLESALIPGWTARRLWPKIDMTRRSSCWVWCKSTQGGGYGAIRLPSGRNARAHRVVWRIIVGPIPEGMDVLHQCDNPPCCNPSHLFLGTQADNVGDMQKKGRARGGRTSRPGEIHPMAKISEVTALQIIERRRNGETGRSVAHALGLSPAQVSRISTGKRWGYLHGGA